MGGLAHTHESGSPARRGRILIVDDDPSVGRSTALVIGSDHDCTVVTGARQALELLERGDRYDVILCDLAMPEMSGIELYEELARRAPALAATMIFVSGGATSATADAFLARHGDAFLTKPYTVQTLLAKIRARMG